MSSADSLHPAWKFLLSSSVAAWLITVWSTMLAFRFLYDDFTYMIMAGQPWVLDPNLRVIGVQLPFWFGTWVAEQRGTPQLGFIIFNVAAWSAVLVAVAVFLKRLGATREEAWLAALLLGMFPGYVDDLARGGSGVQHLLALPQVLFALTAFDVAAGAESRQRQWRFLLLGIGLTLSTMFTKYAVVAIILVAGYMLAFRHGRSRKWLMGFIALGAVCVALFLSFPIQLDAAKVGTGGLGDNLAHLASGVVYFLGPVCGICIALLAVKHGGARASELPGHLGTFYRDVVRQSAGRIKIGTLLLVMAVVFSVPFLFNHSYFPVYYLIYPGVGLSALASRALLRAWPRSLPVAAHLFLSLAIALWFMPWTTLVAAHHDDIRAGGEPAVGNAVAQWLDEARDLFEGVHPEVVHLEARCRRSRDTGGSAEVLRQVYELTEYGDGLRWVLGLSLDVPVKIASEAAGIPTLLYCETAVPRLTLVGSP